MPKRPLLVKKRNNLILFMKAEKKQEKRIIKSYKVPESVYRKAFKKARKNKTTLANLLEDYIYDYAE